MTTIHHFNGGTLHVPPGPKASCHCLLLEDRNGLALVDAGIGLHDVRDPLGRIGQTLIDLAGFQFHEDQTAIRTVERLGFKPTDVTDILLTHADPDHAGGLADFPNARVHVSTEEHAALTAGDPRYLPIQFTHGPSWQTHGPATRTWFGLEARPVDLGFESEVFLIPLFGHTAGHGGVAIQQQNRWTFYVGDAYYLRVELTTDDHPVSALTKARAVDDARRRESLDHLRRLARDHAAEIEMFGYHDFGEFPPDSEGRSG
jgi:glyoxylase-like metal-dependent hydrolase (beta-lactamase superfamily II)